MTSSPEAGRRGAIRVRDELPPALSSMWRLCKLGYRHEAATTRSCTPSRRLPINRRAPSAASR